MRALFMDFNEDEKVHEISNQYMFGKSFMVTPVTQPMYVLNADNKWENPVEDFSQIKTQPVYLPKGTSWYDFWTGEKMVGGQTINKQVPIDIIPLYIKAGTILPWATKVQYATEKWNDLEIRIYTGVDGEFTLYEDENDNYNYQKGAYSTITMKWDEANRNLTIKDRQGKFEGMLNKRNFSIIIVEPANGVGVNSSTIDKKIAYAGKN